MKVHLSRGVRAERENCAVAKTRGEMDGLVCSSVDYACLVISGAC